MDTIHKFTLGMVGIEDVKIPHFQKVISAINQSDNIVVYAEIALGAMTRNVRFAVVGTGNQAKHIDDSWTFLNTVSCHHGKLIWHVYYQLK